VQPPLFYNIRLNPGILILFDLDDHAQLFCDEHDKRTDRESISARGELEILSLFFNPTA
jgi:hypothetical protein